MNINVKGPLSELEYEAQKKLITEKEIKVVLQSDKTSYKELRTIKTRIRELLDFYDRIIRSINHTIKTVSQHKQLSNQQKQKMYLNQQERELYQAKNEKTKFKRYLKKIDDMLNES